MAQNKQTRRTFGRIDKNLPELDLSLVQRESWEQFLDQAISEEITQISPIDDFTGKNWQLLLSNPVLDEPQISVKYAEEKGLTYSIPFRLTATLINKRTGESVEQEVFMGNIPQMTPQGTFIINGIERAVINQLVRSPGIYFSGSRDYSTGRMLYMAEVRPMHGSWLEFEVSKNDVISARIDKRRKVAATTLLRAMGYESDADIYAAFEDSDTDTTHRYIKKTIEKDPTRTREEALLEIYRKLRPGEPAIIDNAQALFESLFLDPRRYDIGRVGRYKVNKRLNLTVPNDSEHWILTRQDVAATISYLIGLQNGKGRIDDIDHLSNRRLRRVGELVATHAFRAGLLKLERSVKEKMSLISADDKPLPQVLINARPLIASINEFFRSNQLSTILDNTNPLAEVDNLRRVSVLGPGGINRERASFSIRDINASQYGRIDPVKSPEGPNIGLVTYLALYTKVNEFGFLETPYRKVEKVEKGGKTMMRVTDEIVYLTADDDADYHITHSNINIDDEGFITDERVAFRFNNSFTEGSVELVDLIDVTPRQVFGASAALIPFLSHDEGNRALMGSNMQGQAVPLISPESPVVGTGLEKEIAKAMGHVIISDFDGVVDYADGDRIEVRLDSPSPKPKLSRASMLDSNSKAVYYLSKFKRTAHSTSYNQKTRVVVGQKVKKGDLLADGPAAQLGELALGTNLLVAYASFEGYGFEDALVVSDRIVKDDSLTSVHIKEYQADVVETKLGNEELTYDIPNVPEEELANLGKDGIVVLGAEVGPNDILVGKIAPKGETELNAEERLLRAIFGEKAREVRDTSLRVPNGEGGIVVDVQVLSKELKDDLGPGILKTVIVRVAQLRKVMVGDKLSGRHGNKGVIAKIMPAADMPYMADGRPVDVVISPLSVLARMNLGQLLEAHLGLALQEKGEKGELPVFDNVHEDTIEKELASAGLPVSGKIRLYDGRTGEPFAEDTVVGVGYVLKLKHMIEDKTHARSTGPYSLVTQQPLGGKAQMGGQRLGEMEVWALEAHRAAHTLQEMLTIKSDDIVGRSQAFGAIIKGEPIPEAKVPESFKVLVRELNSLGLSITIEGAEPKADAAIDELKALDKKIAVDPLAILSNLEDFKSLTIRLASPEEIKGWSRGEVTKPETINYRTLKAEKDGLFDERIFGPTKDWECYCGKYKRIRYKGVICDKCGVEVTESRVRRERMGHISLSAPVMHVWFFKGAPSKVSLLLDLPPRAIEQVVYFARYLVMSIDEGGRTDAIKSLETIRSEKIEEIKTTYESRKEVVREEGEAKKAKAQSRIKGEDQLSLALSEVELEVRKKEASLAEEEKMTLDKTEELFAKLTSIVKEVKKFGFLSEDEYEKLSSYGVEGFVTVSMGAEALNEALAALNLDELSVSLREEIASLKGNKGTRYIKLTRRLKLIDGMRSGRVNPTWVVTKVLPVLPPDLRPMVQLSGGRFATSDLNDLYRRVINRNNRLKHLMSLGAPEIILRNEKRMLQESVDSLIDASQRKATRRGRGKQPLRSLSDMLKGKQGRFRQNLLGKRVDYSGRSVIVVGPELKLNQCGLPKDMALEIFKPFVLREMIVRGIAPNVKSAKNMLERRMSEVYDILEEITKDHPILLNRAPTLHKLGFQAFYPILIEGNAIRLHPAVCKAFNADFDGDQMAVHLPLSERAINEVKELVISDKNLLKPADGSPTSAPSSKEIALGVYYLTSVDTRIAACETIFADSAEAISAHQTGSISLRQTIRVRMGTEVVETTVGRLIFNEAIPEEFGFINDSMSSGLIQDLITGSFSKVPHDRVIKLIDDIKDLGFWGGTYSGLSFGISDAVVHPDKAKIIDEANAKVSEIEDSYAQGLITKDERQRLANEVWMETTEDIANKTWALVEPTSSIRIVIDAKVGRTSREQIKQLAGMRGLVVDPMGKIVELPIKSNFREGLSVFEYVTSSRGSRKGLTDTALKTADAGYLTRRLVDVAHDMIVRQPDCGTSEGIVITRNIRGQVFGRRILGRVVLSDIVDDAGKLIVAKGGVIGESEVKEIEAAKVESVFVRSPLTCKSKHGVCAHCYGWDLSNKEIVNIGSPVGVIAAQSIGEPGTQLTMRTKHSGGVVGVDVTQGLPRVEELFEARVPKSLAPLSPFRGSVAIEELEDGWRIVVTPSEGKATDARDFVIPKTSKLMVENGQLVEMGAQLATGYLDLKELMAIRGLVATQEYLLSELQSVYESQGIAISDRHFEVIIRKMSDKVRVVSSGDTTYLPSETIDRDIFDEDNEKVVEGGEKGEAVPTVMGISKRALYTESWLSAASFEQTTDVLSTASLMGKKDRLLGLKENVIIGRLIPTDEVRAQSI